MQHNTQNLLFLENTRETAQSKEHLLCTLMHEMKFVNSSAEDSGVLSKLFYFPEEEAENLPYYVAQLWPLFLGLVVAEYVGLSMKGERPRLAESLNSLGHGILAETVKILTMGIELSLYISIHRKWRLFDLPWESPVTWFVAFLAVDLAYYCAHRATHEINFLWAQHHVHHSSEDFNIAVAVRHPISHSWINSFFYLPLALLIPPPHCLAHQQFNLIYQAWIHTSLVGNLGPLEYVLNTPSHHKVHHGCNLYVLDTNFGGFLIIWDRLFGTFQPERPNEELVFGIVFQHQSFNPFWQMWHKFPILWKRFKSEPKWKDSLKVVFYGPSWIAGVDAPRLGREQDKVDGVPYPGISFGIAIRPRPKFKVVLPLWLQFYLVAHFLALAGLFQEFAVTKGNLNQMSVGLILTFFIFTLTTIGFLSEANPWGPTFEIFRCLLCVVMAPPSFQSLACLLFIPSAAIWIFFCEMGVRPQGEIKAPTSKFRSHPPPASPINSVYPTSVR